MTRAQIDRENLIRQRMAEEEKILRRVDEDGTRWTKVYFGGGAHFRNWLSQCVELEGEDSRGFQCYEESGEKMYRIWVKDTGVGQGNEQM